MKKLLERQKLTVQIVLDQHKYYFPGDNVEGKIVVHASKSTRIKGIRIVWSGHVRTNLGSGKQDEHVLFKETKQISAARQTSATDHYSSLTPKLNSQDGLVHLEANKPHEFPLYVRVPVDTSLPSCTEVDFSLVKNEDHRPLFFYVE